MKLVFDSNGFQNLDREMTEFQKQLESTISAAEAFQQSIVSSTWEGETKDEFMAFLDLVVQFHQKLAESPNFNKTELSGFSSTIDSLLNTYTYYQQLD